jgi:hypothetical protein
VPIVDVLNVLGQCDDVVPKQVCDAVRQVIGKLNGPVKLGDRLYLHLSGEYVLVGIGDGEFRGEPVYAVVLADRCGAMYVVAFDINGNIKYIDKIFRWGDGAMSFSSLFSN